MAGRIYEYAVLFHHKNTKKEEEDGKAKKSELIVDVKRVIATDERAVAMMAARDIPAEYADRLDQMEIAIRPF